MLKYIFYYYVNISIKKTKYSSSDIVYFIPMLH